MSQLKDSAVVSLNNNDDRGRREFANPLAAAFESTDDVGSKDDGMVEVRFDQIEVSLDDDDDGDGVKKSISAGSIGSGGSSSSNNNDGNDGSGAPVANAVDFLAENNESYEVGWEEAARRISDAAEDPSKPPVPGCNSPYVRFRLRRVVESLYFRAITLILILVDVVVVVVDLCKGGDDPGLAAVDLALTCYFVVEVAARIVALTPPVFFARWYNVVDLVVVVSTFILAVSSQISPAAWTDKLLLASALRLVRLVRLARLYTEKRQLEAAARQLVSQNKRRYQVDGHDLDLTYVTPRVIATSFPSTGLRALYRNPIGKVAAFLDDKHPGHYRMYNLCSERTYDESAFHGRVRRVEIDDHNVPSLQQMLDFAADAREWLGAHPDNVAVVHCKGGKGRTGTMICVWLVECGAFADAAKSLEYFGQRRTDTNVGSKFQGVETPSQSRYVGYFERMRRDLGGRAPSPARALVLRRVELTGMRGLGGRGDGSDFWMQVCQGRGRQVFSAHLGFRRNCRVVWLEEEDLVRVELLNCPVLEGDIRVLFQTSSRLVPKGYESCPFYFWFNTSFLPELPRPERTSKDDDDDARLFGLELNREELDNPHKPKTWHCFGPDFRVKVVLAEARGDEGEKANNGTTAI